MLGMAAYISGTAKLNVLSRRWSKLQFFYSSHKKFSSYREWAEINDPFFFSSFPLQIIKKSCIEILAAEPSSVCAGGGGHEHALVHTLVHTHAMNESYQGIYTEANHPSTFQQILAAASPLLSSVMAMPDCKVTVYGHPGP